MSVGLDGVLWDWNGTLLDDAAHCVGVVDAMLRQRGWGTMDLTRYRAMFGFPVRDYYVQAGFDFAQESFETLSVEFIDRYNAGEAKLQLHAGVVETLDWLARQSCSQAILSASRQDYLESGVTTRGIAAFFEVLGGINDIYAAGKLARGQALLRELGWRPARTLLIGDTLHDAEVGQALGMPVLLVAQGHHNTERLRASGQTVVADQAAVRAFLQNEALPPAPESAV